MASIEFKGVREKGSYRKKKRFFCTIRQGVSPVWPITASLMRKGREITIFFPQGEGNARIRMEGSRLIHRFTWGHFHSKKE